MTHEEGSLGKVEALREYSPASQVHSLLGLVALLITSFPRADTAFVEIARDFIHLEDVLVGSPRLCPPDKARALALFLM